MSITLTQAAADHVRHHLNKRGKGLGIRIGVQSSGCSGLVYKLEYADKLELDDRVFEDKGVKLIVDGKSSIYLQGTQLDYTREGLNEGFKFVNPNEKGRCGCGESYLSLIHI